MGYFYIGTCTCVHLQRLSPVYLLGPAKCQARNLSVAVHNIFLARAPEGHLVYRLHRTQHHLPTVPPNPNGRIDFHPLPPLPGGSPRPVIVEHAETKTERARRPPVRFASLNSPPHTSTHHSCACTCSSSTHGIHLFGAPEARARACCCNRYARTSRATTPSRLAPPAAPPRTPGTNGRCCWARVSNKCASLSLWSRTRARWKGNLRRS
eukprot:9467463-Pyramimonas_sp.AAC.1